MASKLRFKLTDKNGTNLFIPSEAGWSLTVKEVKESDTISLSSLAVGLATITIEGYAESIGFMRGIVLTFKSKGDSVWNTTMIGSMGFDLMGVSGWIVIESIKCYIYTDANTVNASLEFTTDPVG